MQKPVVDLGILVSESDLTGWDPKSVEVVKKYGLSRSDLESYTRTYGSQGAAERQYLTVIATDILSKAYDKKPSPLDKIKEGRDILALVKDLYTRKGLHPNAFVLHELDALDLRLSLGP